MCLKPSWTFHFRKYHQPMLYSERFRSFGVKHNRSEKEIMAGKNHLSISHTYKPILPRQILPQTSSSMNILLRAAHKHNLSASYDPWRRPSIYRQQGQQINQSHHHQQQPPQPLDDPCISVANSKPHAPRYKNLPLHTVLHLAHCIPTSPYLSSATKGWEAGDFCLHAEDGS